MRQIRPKTSSFKTPWWLVLLGRTPMNLINGRAVVESLNPPCAIPNPSWIIPGKVIRDMELSTDSAKKAIDNLVEVNGKYVLLDAGWYGDEHDTSSVPTAWLPAPKEAPLDLLDVIQYGKERDIGVFLYVNDLALKQHINEIAPLYASWGVAGIKMGFVNLDSSEDTSRILSYVKLCATHRLLVNIHDNYCPSGISRTYPNLLSIEGVRGDEHKPDTKHALMLPFLRFLAGQADHTFVFRISRLQEVGKTPMHQIALPLIYFNPLQHIFWYSSQENIPELLLKYPNLQVWKVSRYVCPLVFLFFHLFLTNH